MKRHFIVGVIIGLFAFLIMLLVINTEVFKSMELKFIDYRYNFRLKHNINPDIAIIAIDDGSINMFGRWPWPRKIHAALLKAISRYPPKAIGFDILFTEPEKGDAEGDTALSYYTKLLGNVVYAGYISAKEGKAVLPIEQLMDGGSTGFINAWPDKDGIIRRVPLIIKTEKDFSPSFVTQILCAYLNIDFKAVSINLGENVLFPGLGTVPIDKDGCMWINYVGDQHVFSETAFQQILNGDAVEKLSNKLVLTGITATGIGDIGHIPVAVNVPLIAVHANALNTIINKDFIYKTPFILSILILFICIIISTFINLFFRPVKAGLLSLLFLVSYNILSIWLFRKNIWVDILSPSLGLIVPFIFITIYRYGWEEKERRKIKKIFSHYLSKDVIDVLIKEPQKLQLGGELKTATVLYVDLRNFSTYCEHRTPKEVISLLNQCFDWMTEIILRHGGMLDKYIGDAIMAVFGAPIDMSVEEQAKLAVSTALEIVNKWHEMPKEVRANLDVGIGINTGHMLIGNMGSRYIFNYTAVGDEVNVAARIQGLTGEYKTNILITESVNSLIAGRYKTESLGKAPVKGRKGHVVIYKVEPS